MMIHCAIAAARLRVLFGLRLLCPGDVAPVQVLGALVISKSLPHVLAVPVLAVLSFAFVVKPAHASRPASEIEEYSAFLLMHCE